MRDGCWATYYYDGNPQLISVHPDELEASRAALKNSAYVVFLRWGCDLSTAIDESRAEA